MAYQKIIRYTLKGKFISIGKRKFKKEFSHYPNQDEILAAINENCPYGHDGYIPFDKVVITVKDRWEYVVVPNSYTPPLTDEPPW